MEYNFVTELTSLIVIEEHIYQTTSRDNITAKPFISTVGGSAIQDNSVQGGLAQSLPKSARDVGLVPSLPDSNKNSRIASALPESENNEAIDTADSSGMTHTYMANHIGYLVVLLYFASLFLYHKLASKYVYGTLLQLSKVNVIFF